MSLEAEVKGHLPHGFVLEIRVPRGDPWRGLSVSEQIGLAEDTAALVAVAGEMRNALSRARAILVRLNTPLESDERAVVRELDRLLAATRPG